MSQDKLMTKDQSRELSNAVYAAVYTAIFGYEQRGFNAHSRAQQICESVERQCNDWIALQRGHSKCDHGNLDPLTCKECK